jgi:hypothetical protein
MTSSLVAGVDETLCLQSWQSSSHSLGGRIESSSSSVSLLTLPDVEDVSLAAASPESSPAAAAEPPFGLAPPEAGVGEDEESGEVSEDTSWAAIYKFEALIWF